MKIKKLKVAMEYKEGGELRGTGGATVGWKDGDRDAWRLRMNSDFHRECDSDRSPIALWLYVLNHTTYMGVDAESYYGFTVKAEARRLFFTCIPHKTHHYSRGTS